VSQRTACVAGMVESNQRDATRDMGALRALAGERVRMSARAAAHALCAAVMVMAGADAHGAFIEWSAEGASPSVSERNGRAASVEPMRLAIVSTPATEGAAQWMAEVSDVETVRSWAAESAQRERGLADPFAQRRVDAVRLTPQSAEFVLQGEGFEVVLGDAYGVREGARGWLFVPTPGSSALSMVACVGLAGRRARMRRELPGR